jgi:hypothetical protein
LNGSLAPDRSLEVLDYNSGARAARVNFLVG